LRLRARAIGSKTRWESSSGETVYSRGSEADPGGGDADGGDRPPPPGSAADPSEYTVSPLELSHLVLDPIAEKNERKRRKKREMREMGKGRREKGGKKEEREERRKRTKVNRALF